MDFREFFLANEFMLKGIKDIRRTLVPSTIAKKGFRDSGGAGIRFWLPKSAPSTPYKPKAIFRKPS